MLGKSFGKTLDEWQVSWMMAGRVATMTWRNTGIQLQTALHFGKLETPRVCPCCDRQFVEWADWSATYRKANCPYCYCQPRHRLFLLYLKQQTNFDRDRLKVLHFAPEPMLRHRFQAMANLEYITADLNDTSVDVKIDITNIPYADNTFDVIFCSHVLEHIPADHKAMTELLRILKPGGWAYLQVPLDRNSEKTFEDSTITSPSDRRRYYLQEDHVRLYGLDYKDKLAAAGFIVKIENLLTTMSTTDVEKYGLLPPDTEIEELYFGFKPQVQPTLTDSHPLTDSHQL